MTGVLSETGALTNSYCYDSYGNLTSGTPEAVNYYGYNGESANIKTGFQYLRARYYYAENGAFTTEDSDLGTKENPLTRNRYSYVMNNPLNYVDPTGHRAKAASGIGRTGAVVKSIGNIAKTVTNAVKAVAGVVMAVGSIHAQAAQTGGTKGQTRGAYQSGYVPSGKFGGRLSYIQYMSKMVTQQMRVVLCTNQRQKVSGASATAVPALPWVLPWLEKAGEVFGAIILGIFFYEGTKEDKDSKDSLEGWGDEQEEKKKEQDKDKTEDVLDSLPENVKDSYEKYEKDGWRGHRSDQSKETKAGARYKNRDGQLPKVDQEGNEIIYREYDVNDGKPGQNRDSERFVRGSDGSVYYTDDHYNTFTKIN